MDSLIADFQPYQRQFRLVLFSTLPHCPGTGGEPEINVKVTKYNCFFVSTLIFGSGTITSSNNMSLLRFTSLGLLCTNLKALIFLISECKRESQ